MKRPSILGGSTLVALFLTASLATAPSAAQEDEARELFTQGQAAYETGDYDTAVQSWERAYQIDPRPLLQYNLAQAYERLGQLDRAVAAYRVYVNNTPGDDQRAQNARARIASLETRLTNTSIALTGGVEGARVTIDGQDRGLLPHPDPFRVEAGNHRIVIRADGYEDFVSTVAVSAGQAASVPVEMRAGTTGGASDGGGGGGGISPIGVGVAAGGGAVLIAGAITGGLALAAAGDAPSATSSQADDARTLALVTDILIPTGAVIAAVGIVLMFVLDDGGSGGSAQVVPVVGPDVAGAVFNTTF
ncbi:MAG: tetratricopeptide repeat protein [Sandaracinaceae bacterium]